MGEICPVPETTLRTNEGSRGIRWGRSPVLRHLHPHRQPAAIQQAINAILLNTNTRDRHLFLIPKIKQTIMRKKQRQYHDIVQPLSEIADFINDVLDSRKKEEYFHSIVLLYSLIENLLKWLVCMKVLWDKAQKALHPDEVKAVREFCRRMTYYTALQVALSVNLIDLKLYKRLDQIRMERNDLIHQFWLYSHRDNRLVLRKKLEKLSNSANTLIGVFNSLTKDIGLEDIYQLFL